MNYSFVYAILVLFCFQVVLTKHTLHVDTVVPSSGSSIVLNDVKADILIADSVDVQYISVEKTATTGLVVGTKGPTTFGASHISFDSAKLVNITAGSTLQLTTPGALSLNGDHLNLGADRFFSTVGGDFLLNTEGSITATAWDTSITSDNNVDLHVATGVLEALAAEEFKITGDQIEFVGDDKVSLYSFSMISVEAVDNFAAYANFIDFDSYGNIHLNSGTGNVEVDTVFNAIFEGDVISASAPNGIDLKTEHGSIYVTGKDEIKVNSAETIYLDADDEIHYLTEQLFSINANSVTAIVGENVHFNAKTAEIGWGIGDISAYNIRANTGGDITLSLGGLTGNSKYDFNALEHIEFTGRNIFGNSERLKISARQDLEIEVQDRIGSELLVNSETEVLLYGGRNLQSKNSQFEFHAGQTRVSGETISFKSEAIVEDELNFEAGLLFQATANNIVGSAETGIWQASDELSINAGTFVYSAGIERDDLLFIDAVTNSHFLSSSKISIISKLGESLFEAKDITIKQSADAAFTSRESTIILAPNTFNINAGSSVSIKSNEAVFESNNLAYSARDSVSFVGSWFDLWASGTGSYIANEDINFVASGSVNLRAFSDIVIDNISTLSSPIVHFEAVESADFTAFGGISFQNSGTFDLLTGSRSDFTFDGNSVVVSANEAISINSGFVYMNAVDDIAISGVNKFSVDTLKEENVLFEQDTGFFFSTEQDSIFGSDDDILISALDGFIISTIGSLVIDGGEGSDWISEKETIGIATSDVTFSSFLDLSIYSGGSFNIFSSSIHYTVDRVIDVDSLGGLQVSTGGSLTLNSAGEVSLIQKPFIAETGGSNIFTINSVGTTFTTTGSFTQTGGSTSISTNQFDWESSQSILHSSTIESNFESSNILFDASVTNGLIRLESDDFQAEGSGKLLQRGGLIDYSSTDSEPIVYTASTSVYIESNANSPITWTAKEDWNVTALAGLQVLAHNINDNKIGIHIDNQDDIMSDISFITRNGKLEIHSLLTQLFDSDEIEIISGRDIHWSNFYASADVGGASITSEGSEHDGYYQDEVGIVLRSILPFGTIDFNVPRGQIDIDSGNDLREIIRNSGANFTADNEITFWAKNGNFHLKLAQGKTTIDSEHQSVTFTTNKNTEIKSQDAFSVIAGKEIQLISNAPITNPNNDLSFEFSANNGNILVQNQAGFNINFEGNDFYSTSAENSTFLASDNIPIQSNQGSIHANGDTGLHKTVLSGDLYLTSSKSVNFASGPNSDIRVLSGANTNFNADRINITSEINGFLRSSRGNILIRTNDTTADVQINGEGEIKFQADGASGNNQHGIFVIAPTISTSADRSTIIDAEVAVTIGTVTRPIIQFEAGGDAKQNGVTFTSEGNVIQNIGVDFNLNANGYYNLHTAKNLELLSGGSATVTSLGTHPNGKNVVFESDGQLKLTAGNVQINGEERVTLRGDELVELKTTGNNPSLSFISLNIANDLISDINGTLDINSANWNTVSVDYYNIFTFGAVEFQNPNPSTGSILISADTYLEFSSDVDMDFKTILPSSSISLSSLGSNSNMEFRTFGEDADIFFQTNNTLTITAQDDFNIESTHSSSITAPLTKTGKSDNSNVVLNSVDDIIYENGFDLLVQSVGELTISTTDAGGAEIDIEADGEILLQSWQNSYYSSTTNEISFLADYNITFRTYPGHEGSILLQSTRDIINTFSEGDSDGLVVGKIGGDFSITATRSFEIESIDDDILLRTIGTDSNILFDVKLGKFIIDSGYGIIGTVGEAHTAANIININSGDDFLIATVGVHNPIDIISDQGLITLTTTDDDFIIDVGSFVYDTNTAIPSRSGNGFIDYQARGGSNVGFSIQMISLDDGFEIDSSAFVNLWSAEKLNITTTDEIYFGHGYLDSTAIISSNSPGGNMEIYALDELSIGNNGAEGDIHFLASNEIGIFPFDSLEFTASGKSTDAANSGILFETDHPLADLVMFTTDFLTADITVNAESYNSYSRDATTYLLLDDDDSQFVGTYLFDAVSMKFSAESDITIQETSSGDIQIDTLRGKTYFTAGGSIIMNVREQTLLTIPTLFNVEATDDINFNQQQLSITATADITFRTTENIKFVQQVFADPGNDLLSTSDSLLISIDSDDNDITPHSYDISFNALQGGVPILLNTIGATTEIYFSGPTNTDQRTTVDFKHGLVLPMRSGGIGTGAACTNIRDFFYDQISERFCVCGTAGTLQCRQAYPVAIAADFIGSP